MTDKDKIKELERRIAELTEALYGVCNQFAIPRKGKRKRLVLSSGCCRALEDAFDLLDWTDPYPCPWLECNVKGCYKEMVGGTPTKNGYKSLCSEHYQELSIPPEKVESCPTKP